MYAPKQLRPTAAKATKKQRILDEADAQPLNITETARYQTMNPVRPAAPVAEVIDVAAEEDEYEVSDDDAESPEELLDFFSAALGHEQQDAMAVRQDRLDVELLKLLCGMGSMSLFLPSRKFQLLEMPQTLRAWTLMQH